MGKRIFVSDVQESVFMVRYKRAENQLIIFADDTHPRWITCTSVLDYDTVAVADKFGNIAILRLPPNVSDDVEEDPTGHKSLWDRGSYFGIINCFAPCYFSRALRQIIFISIENTFIACVPKLKSLFIVPEEFFCKFFRISQASYSFIVDKSSRINMKLYLIPL